MLGDVQAKGSGELKNILVERVDSIEPMLARHSGDDSNRLSPWQP